MLRLLKYDPSVFYQVAREVCDYYVRSEYGLTNSSKMSVALSIAGPLFSKIYADLIFWRAPSFEEEYWKYIEKETKRREDLDSTVKSFWRHIRTRLYFTSASHLYSLFFLLTLGGKGALLDSCGGAETHKIKNINQLGYLSSIVLRLF